MDQAGRLFIEPSYDAIGEFKSFGYAVMQSGGKVGVIDNSGVVVVPALYEDVKILDELLFAVMDNAEWMVINKTGDIILEKGYEQIKLLDHAFIIYKKDRKWGAANYAGQKIGQAIYDEFTLLDGRYLGTSLDGFYGIMNEDGLEILAPEYAQVEVFSDDLFLFRKGKLWGGVGAQGEQLFNSVFNRYQKVSDSFLMLTQKSKVFLFSLARKGIVGNEGFDKFQSFDEDRVLGLRKGKLALIDASGNILLSPQYDEIQSFSGDIFRVKNKNKWGLVRPGDEFVIDYKFDYIAPLQGRPVSLVKLGQFTGLINQRGEELTSFDFGRIVLEENLAKAYKGKELSMFHFDEDGNLEEASQFKKHLKINFGKRRNLRNNIGALDEGNLLDDFEWFYDGESGKWGLRRLDNGEIQIKPAFDEINIHRNLGFTVVGIEKLGRYNIGRTEYGFEMVYGLVNNEKGLLIRMVDMWDIKFSDFNAGSNVARCMFENGRMGLINRIGKVVLKDYAYIGEFHHGLARMSAKGRLGAELKKTPYSLGKVLHFTNQLMSKHYMSDYTLYDRAIRQDGLLTCDDCEWGYVDTAGVIITPSNYNFARNYKNKVGIVESKKGKWGMLATDGKELLACDYDGVEFLERTGNEILRIHKNQEKYGLIDTLGQVTVNLKYDEIGAFKDDRLAVKKSGLWGFVDPAGREVITCQFRRVNNFMDGVAVVKRGTKWGAIDKHGQVLIDFKYSRLGNFQNGLALVHTNKGVGFMDVEERMRIEPAFQKAFDFQDGVARVVEKGRYKLIHPSGKYVNGSTFGQIFDFDEAGLAIVRFTGTKVRYGIINRAGEVVTKQKYNRIEAYQEDLARVRFKGKYGFIDRAGNVVVPAIYSQANSFSEGRAAVMKDGYWGFVDAKGNEVIELEYTRVLDFDKGKAVVYNGYKKGGIIDLDGNYIIEPGVNRLLDFSEGRGLVRDESYRFYYITEGMDWEDSFYQQASEFQHGVAVVQLNGRWGIINKKGIEIIPPKYDKIEAFKDGYAKVRIKQFTGLTNTKGELIVRPDYEYISYAGSGLFRVEQGDKIGYFDSGGNWIWRLSE